MKNETNYRSINIFTFEKQCWWFLSTVIATVKIIAISSVSWSSAYAQQCLANMLVTTETELNDAINCHNDGGVGDFNSITIVNDIDLSGTLSPLTLDNPNGALFISSANSSQVKLTGPGSSSTGTIPLLALRSSAKITIKNLKLQAADGAAILVSDLAREVILDTVSLFDSGTGLEIKAGHVSFLNSDSKGNKRNGINLENDFSGVTPVLTMRNSEVAFNTAEGITYNNGDPNEFGSITESTITNNGIGISMVDSNLDVNRSVVRNNTGDGIIAAQGDLNVAHSIIEGNGIGINMSGILAIGSTIFNTGIYSNAVGIQAITGNFTIDSSTISSNDGTGISLGGGWINPNF